MNEKIEKRNRSLWMETLKEARKYLSGESKEINEVTHNWLRRYALPYSNGELCGWMFDEMNKAGIKFDFKFNSVIDLMDYIEFGFGWVLLSREMEVKDELNDDLRSACKLIAIDRCKFKRRKNASSAWREWLYSSIGYQKMVSLLSGEAKDEDQWMVMYKKACSYIKIGVSSGDLNDKEMSKWLKIECYRYIYGLCGKKREKLLVDGGLVKWVAKGRLIFKGLIESLESYNISNGSYRLLPYKSNPILLNEVSHWAQNRNIRALKFLLDGCLDFSNSNLRDLAGVGKEYVKPAIKKGEDVLAAYLGVSPELITGSIDKLKRVRALNKDEVDAYNFGKMCVEIKKVGLSKITSDSSRLFSGACKGYVDGSLCGWSRECLLSVVDVEEVHQKLGSLHGWSMPIRIFKEMREKGVGLVDLRSNELTEWKRGLLRRKRADYAMKAFGSRMMMLDQNLTQKDIDLFFMVVDR